MDEEHESLTSSGADLGLSNPVLKTSSNPTHPSPSDPTLTSSSSTYTFPEVYSVPPSIPPSDKAYEYPSTDNFSKEGNSDIPALRPGNEDEIVLDPHKHHSTRHIDGDGVKGALSNALHPKGVAPQHRKYEHWVGRVGFGAKGLVYGFVGGMTCASASRQHGEVNGSPQGAFILIGTFPAGDGLLVVMLIALICYIVWRWWEFATFQGADATNSTFKNFFAYRLSPFISGCVYAAYSYYIIQILHHTSKHVCYPNCWRETKLGQAGLVLFGVAFCIATITQLQNSFTSKWHPEINWRICNKFEKWMLLSLGHIGFSGRAGLFLFVAIVMFRALRAPVKDSGNTISNGVNQFVGNKVGEGFMWLVGILVCHYGLFALLCARYRYFPTPPPSGKPLYPREGDEMVYANNIHQTGIDPRRDLDPHRLAHIDPHTVALHLKHDLNPHNIVEHLKHPIPNNDVNNNNNNNTAYVEMDTLADNNNNNINNNNKLSEVPL